MRILGVIDSFNLGGAETQLAQILTFFADHRGHDCIACSLLPPRAQEAAFGTAVARVYLNKVSRFSLPRITLELRRLIRRVNPSVVYSRLPLANALSRIGTLGAGASIRHVAGVDTVPEMFTLAYTLAHPGSLLFRRLERYADCIVCNSEGTRRAVVEAGYRRTRVRMVPCGIDVQHYRPDSTHTPTPRPQLLCVASLRPEKGVDRLIEVLAPLLRAHSVDLRVLGDGGEREKIERTIARLGVRHAVELLGARQDVLPALQASDIYVSAALVEGFGVSIAEAAAVELPTVAFAVPGGLSELIVDRTTGYLVDEKDPQAYREAVERLCGDVELRRRMGEAARRHVMEHFSLSQVAEALEACFHAP